MIPPDEHYAWHYEEEGDSTVPITKNTVSGPSPQTWFEAGDQEDFSSPFLQKSNKEQRRIAPLFWIFVLVLLLALGAGFTANAFGVSTRLSQVLHQPTQAQNRATTPVQGIQTPGAVQPGGENRTMQTPQFPQTLPAEWAASGHTATDAADAAVIAQGFTERYESIEGSTQQSLAVSLVDAQLFMTRNEQLRYQGRVAGIAPDPHFTQQFASQFQIGTANRILSQQALTSGMPQMLPPQLANGTFYALMIVPYQKMVTFQSGRVLVTEEHMTIAMVTVSKSGRSIPNVMGWAVVTYMPGTAPPPLPTQP